MKGVRLRHGTPEDVPAMAALMESLPEWFTAEAVGEVRKAGATMPGLVALDRAGTLIGFLLWQPRQSECEITWIAVRRDRHRQGVGRTLMARMLELVQKAGVKHVRVATVAPTVEYEPYARTRAFYEARGFTLQEIKPGGWPDGTDRADYVLELAEQVPGRPAVESPPHNPEEGWT